MHGDDITSDAGGEDCYRFVKAAGRFLVVKRTPGISTTDLVGRMLLCTRNHFIKSFLRTLSGEEGPSNPEERKRLGEEMSQRIKDYATDESGLQPGLQVLSWMGSQAAKEGNASEETGSYQTMVHGNSPRPRQRIVYVDGGFDLFSSGHIEFLRQVSLAEEKLARESGWYEHAGNVSAPAYIVVGVHDDDVINHWKGINYPIMNIFERGLCVLQCRVRRDQPPMHMKLMCCSTSTRSYFPLRSPLAKHTSAICLTVFPAPCTMDLRRSCHSLMTHTQQPEK